MIKKIKEHLIVWCKEHNGYIRIPFLVFFGYVFIEQIKDPSYSSILDRLNLGIHEVGHFLFGIFGNQFIGIAGGTIFQLFAPLYGMYNFLKLRDYFSVVLCFGWLSTNFYDVAIYVADARSMQLELVAPFNFGGHVIHDWNYMLNKMHMANFDHFFGFMFCLLGFISMLFCLIVGAWMIWKMMTLKKEKVS